MPVLLSLLIGTAVGDKGVSSSSSSSSPSSPAKGLLDSFIPLGCREYFLFFSNERKDVLRTGGTSHVTGLEGDEPASWRGGVQEMIK